jgi:signal transduction histidine kinase
MKYAYTPAIWPSVLTAVLLIILTVYAWRRRSVPGAIPFMFACLFAAAWAAGSVMEYAAVDLATKIAWVKFQSACSLPVIIAITCFILEYAWPGRWLTRRVLALLAFTWLLEIVLILTNDFHHWLWRGFGFDGSVLPRFGPGAWLIIAYGIGVLGILNLIVLGWLFLRSPLPRWPLALMLTGQIGGRLLFLLDRANLFNSILPLELLGMAFEFSMYAIALFGFSILDPITLARQAVTAQMREGVLVLDPQRQVAGLNPAAAAILGLPESRLHGCSIRELIPSYTDPPDEEVGESEVSLGSGPETHFYLLETSALKDWRGLAVGRLLLLHDVTAQKRARAQLLEQQRALAILAERERLARELHDDLGQVLAFISTQGHVVQELLDRGEVATAGSYVARLIEAADEADTDIRESILSLRSPFGSQGLIPALQDYLRRYEQRYGLRIEVLLPEHRLESAFEPVAEVQILRILQEGLANARKHAQARCVQVAFTLLEERIQIVLRDDGQGFEPGEYQADRPRGFGLQFMRERAEAIGGSLEVHSAPGEGTEIVLVVPLKETHV